MDGDAAVSSDVYQTVMCTGARLESTARRHISKVCLAVVWVDTVRL